MAPTIGSMSRDEGSEQQGGSARDEHPFHRMLLHSYPFYLGLGTVVCVSLLAWDVLSRDPAVSHPMPDTVVLSWYFCGVAYFCQLLVSGLKLAIIRSSSRNVHLLGCYVAFLASLTYIVNWLGLARHELDMKSMLYIPSRWLLYTFTAPAIWWIIAHISGYSEKRKLYVLWLNTVMIIAGGLATIPSLSWGHKVYWMVLSCVPFPELCYHMWRMISDASESFSDNLAPSGFTALHFLRIFGQLCYQFFPAIYFAAFDGCLPLAVCESLWTVCDWTFKMVMTSSLMEANFYTLAQRREHVLRLMDQAQSFHRMKQLTQEVERKDLFLSSMSHELRTPLNGILGMAQAVTSISQGNLSPAVQHTIDVIKLSGKRLLQLINDILDVAQIRKGVLLIQHEDVQVQRLIDDIIELMVPMVPPDMRLYKKVGPMPTIIGDGRRIAQILFNLVGNAFKFTSRGFVKIIAGHSPSKRAVFIAIRDTGCGIPACDVKKAFTVFEQGDMTTTRTHGGTGLGLHLVQELVRAHRGQINIQSRVSEGTIFTVWLPLEQPRDDEAGENQELPPVKICLEIEDELREPEFETAFLEEQVSHDHAASTLPFPLPSSHSATAPNASEEARYSHSGAHPQSAGGDARAHVSQAHNAVPSQRPAPSSAHSPFAAANLTMLPTQAAIRRISSTGAEPKTELDALSGSVTRTGRNIMFHSEVYGIHLILTVDDDPVNQMVFSNLLQPLGYKLRQALNGREAMSMLQELDTLPDVILLDCMMPGLSGYDVCRMVREEYGYAIPIIMVSANSSQTQVLMGLEEGANDYIKKPFHRDELNMRICAHIRTSQLFTLELEARSPLALLRLPLTLPMHDAIKNGHTLASEASPHSVLLHGRLPHLQLGSQALPSRDLATMLAALSEYLKRTALQFGVMVCLLSGATFVCVPRPGAVPDSVRASHMLLFATQIMTGISEMLQPYGALPLPSIALAAGPLTLSVLSTLVQIPRYVVLGKAALEARALCRLTPAGCIYAIGLPENSHITSQGFSRSHLEVELCGRTEPVLALSSAPQPDEPMKQCPSAQLYLSRHTLSMAQDDLRSLEERFYSSAEAHRSEDASQKIVRILSVARRRLKTFSNLPRFTPHDVPFADEDDGASSSLPTWFVLPSSRPSSIASPSLPGSTSTSQRPSMEMRHQLTPTTTTHLASAASVASGVARQALAAMASLAGGLSAADPASAPTTLSEQSVISAFCRHVGAEAHVPAFQEAGLTVQRIANMTESQLCVFGVTDIGMRVRMIVHAKLATAQRPPDSASVTDASNSITMSLP